MDVRWRGVEIPCIYNLYGDKINKRYVRKELCLFLSERVFFERGDYLTGGGLSEGNCNCQWGRGPI